MKKIVLTVDLEPDFGILNTTKCMKVLPRFLRMLDEIDIKATFFVSGGLFPKFKKELKDISQKHEIGCHGINHDRLTNKPIEQVKYELEEACELFRENLGIAPLGFRAPFWGINEEILKILPKVGFSYDSSIVPGFLPWRYLNLRVEREPYYMKDLLELPITRMVVPFGSTWAQFVGKKLFSWFFSLSKRSNIVIYSHMNEFCSEHFDLNLIRTVFYRNRGEKALNDFGSFLNECKKRYKFVLAKDFLE